MRYATFLLVFVFSVWGTLPAASQPQDIERFYPIDEGDVREYTLWEGGQLIFQRHTVVGDTLISGDTYALVVILKRDLSLVVLGEERCATRYDSAEHTINWVSVYGACQPFGVAPYPMQMEYAGSGASNQTRWIGGTSYDLQVVEPSHVVEEGEWYTFDLASGIGPVSTDRFSQGYTYIRSSLVYAVVGGEVYGTSPEEHEWSGFLPLEVGDNWVYENNVVNGGPPSVHTLVRTSVVGDTTIAGDTFMLVSESHYEPEGDTLVAIGRYAVRAPAGRLEVVDVVPLDSWPGNPSSVWKKFSGMPDLRNPSAYRRGSGVEVGGIQYDVDVARNNHNHECGLSEYIIARGIGVTYTRSASWCGSSGAHNTIGITLLAADISGEVYGNPVLLQATEGATQAEGVSMVLYPNPAWTSAELVIENARPLEADVALFDVLGRQVHRRDLGVQPAGSSQHRLELVDLPAGLYVVRVTTASGETATRRLVKVD